MGFEADLALKRKNTLAPSPPNPLAITDAHTTQAFQLSTALRQGVAIPRAVMDAYVALCEHDPFCVAGCSVLATDGSPWCGGLFAVRSGLAIIRFETTHAGPHTVDQRWVDTHAVLIEAPSTSAHDRLSHLEGLAWLEARTLERLDRVAQYFANRHPSQAWADDPTTWDTLFDDA